MDFLSLSPFGLVLSLLASLLALATPSLFYGYLADLTWFEDRGKVRSQVFDATDALIAAGLALLFAAMIINGFSAQASAGVEKLPSGSAMILGVVLSTLVFLLIMAGIAGSLIVRDLPWREAFGVTRLGVGGIISRAAFLILLALPLITVTMAATRMLLAAAGHPAEGLQDIVRFLAEPGSGAARIVVAGSAVLIAPVQEEFIFRGYIYGVVRRYAGPFVGILVNALLFAGIHLHAPSFGGLFVLAVCLTLAYEWTGSIFVPMTMHALFNSLSVIGLLTGGANH